MALPTFNNDLLNNKKTGIPIIKAKPFSNTSEEDKISAEALMRNKNKHIYTRSLLEKGFSNVRENTIEELKVLNSEILMNAPKNFFDKYEKLTKELVILIQNNLSTTDKSAVISELKTDPTNETLKQRAFYTINAEIINYDNNPKHIEYNNLDDIEKRVLSCLVINEITGLGPLEPLFDDFNIREIICNGPFDVQVEISGIMHKVPSCKFRDKNHLNDLISKLYNSVNKSLSRNMPIERARLHDNSRVFAVHDSVAPKGPNLNIRRHTDNWISPNQLLKWGMISPEVLEWIGQMVYSGLSFAIIGSTGTGKTTFLGAITGFIRPNARIVTIEKNIELKLPPHKLAAAPMEAVPPQPGSEFKGVTLRDLVEASTQQRPDVIILGEATGGEMFDVATALNSGHQGFSTVHADSPEDTPKRMMTLMTQSEMIKGKAAYELLATAFDVIVEIKRFSEDGSRWVTAIHEVGMTPRLGENQELYLPTYPIWEFVPNEVAVEMKAKIDGKWLKVGELSDKRKAKYRIGLEPLPDLLELIDIATPKEGEY